MSNIQKIKIFSTTFSLDCGDHKFFSKNEEFVDKLLFNCESLLKVNNRECKPELTEVSLATYQLKGKVIYKGEYLLIIENIVRLGLVVNNSFSFGNHVRMGNKDIDHKNISIGDWIEAKGNFIFSPFHLCVFTFDKSEFDLPIVDYKWKATTFYSLKEEILNSISNEDEEDLYVEPLTLSSFKEVEEFHYKEPCVNPVIMEFTLVEKIPVIVDQEFIGISGNLRSHNWISSKQWIINKEGRISNGVKHGHWFYIDKTGKEKIEIDYGEPKEIKTIPKKLPAQVVHKNSTKDETQPPQISSKTDIHQWIERKKIDPIGSIERKLYDASILKFSDYLERYYSAFPNLNWNMDANWVHWYNDFIEPAYGNNEELKSRTGYYGGDVFFKQLNIKYNDYYGNLGLDNELQRIFAFMDTDGFFHHFRITFLEWLECKNYTNPTFTPKKDARYNFTVNQILKMEYGQNYLKDRLKNLNWWNFSRDPQGG